MRRRPDARRGLQVTRLALALCCGLALCAAAARAQGPATLTFDELVQLHDQDVPPAPLQRKLDALLTTPFVDNSRSERVRPRTPVVPGLGPVLRIVQWNIERGIEFDAIAAALSGGTTLAPLLDGSRYPEGDARTSVLRDADRLRDADVIILNEVDRGLKRSDYRFVAKELAGALDMNYAYGVEFVEVDPIALGTETFDFAEEADRAELRASIEVDRSRLEALHGNAILSRYRLDHVRIVRFETQGHDWFGDEKKGPSQLEKGKRTAAEKAFLTTISREVRRGGRMFMVAELADPRFPGGRMTLVNAHLEAKGKPAARAGQLEELLAYVKSLDGPLVVGGDMNTTGSDSTPTSITREITRRVGSADYWARKGVLYFTGYGFLASGVGFVRGTGDPTVRSIPIINPNREAKFFSLLRDFRFADGGWFDFRGDRERSAGGRDGTLSNSNERASKGFATTFQVDRAITTVGRLKLDWLFVKVPAGAADGPAPPPLAPFFGTTYKDLNYAAAERLSDHEPISVDLPLPPGP